VAPEERGARVAEPLMVERIQAARERGAVLASMWTSSTGYVRHLGWEAVAPVFAWEAPTDDLRAFPAGDLEVRYGETPEGRFLQRELAREWNGPVERPAWWSTWKQRKSDLLTYEFTGPGQRPAGVLSFAMVARRPRGHDLVVHDLWAADLDAARAMLSFLGRYHSRAQTVQFRRAALAPYPVLLQGLRSFRLSAQAWHPWMLRVLDAPQALRLRGWPEHAAFEIALGIEGEPRALLLSVEHGVAHARPTDAEPTAVFSRGQFAVWYAGGIASPVSARMSGVTGDPGDLARLVDATRAQEPWLPDLF
jgi:predicted acetyltransferase